MQLGPPAKHIVLHVSYKNGHSTTYRLVNRVSVKCSDWESVPIDSQLLAHADLNVIHQYCSELVGGRIYQ